MRCLERLGIPFSFFMGPLTSERSLDDVLLQELRSLTMTDDVALRDPDDPVWEDVWEDKAQFGKIASWLENRDNTTPYIHSVRLELLDGDSQYEWDASICSRLQNGPREYWQPPD